jgi:hypothetical protein
MDWKRLARKLLPCWVGDGAKDVCGGGLAYGKTVENVLRRCTHAFGRESSDASTITLSALAEDEEVEREDERGVVKRPYLNELDVPEWAELALDNVEWRKLLQRIAL